MSVSGVDAVTNAAGILEAPKGPSLDRHVQSVFSDVLAEAGRAGYASASAVETDAPLETSLRNAWDDWSLSERVNGRYASRGEDYAEFKQPFGDLLVRAHAEGGYLDPQGFLADLTADELATIQSVHSLAEPIDVAGLTEEGALNLLLPPVAQVDVNRDGLTQSGAAFGIRFPNSDTPADVVAAWDTATAGMPFGERMMYELRMMTPVLTANIVVDANGAFLERYEPGDPEFTNPMARPDYSYRDAVREQLDGVEFAKRWLTQQQYEQQSTFWTHFGEELDARNA